MTGAARRAARCVPWLVALGLGASALTACGGGGAGEAKEPEPGPVLEEPPEEPPDPGLIPPEDLEAVSLFFERKRTVISRCFIDAIDAGEIPANVRRAFLTVTVTVLPSGQAENVVFTETAANSALLESCTRERILSWALPEVSQRFDYSHRYGFSAL